jgi:hypothetical protein
MLVRLVAGLLFVAFLWSLFRYAMGMRALKRAREQAMEREAAAGRRVVAEVPLQEGMLLVLDDGAALCWGAERQPFAEIAGARVLLNGGVLAGVARAGVALPEPGAAEEYEGSERWQVRLYRRDGSTRDVPCGKLREGVSREIAMRVFEVVGAAVRSGDVTPPTGGSAAPAAGSPA